MTDDGRFDHAARTYDATVQSAIAASGETVQFFAELKVSLMAQGLGDCRPATILDFGCGIGNTTRAIGSKFPHSRILGFDVSSESVAIARQLSSSQSAQIEYVSATGARLP